MKGYEVWATDSEIGRLEGFILDDASWHLVYLWAKRSYASLEPGIGRALVGGSTRAALAAIVMIFEM